MPDDVITVLVIDPDADDARRTVSLLARHARVESVATLDAALTRLDAVRCDAVLVEPGAGDAADSVARVTDRAPGCAVLIVTRAPDDRAAPAALRRGAQDYVLKSDISAPSLLRAVRYAIERQRAGALRATATPDATRSTGRYKLLVRLGSGGMGEVYLATREGPEAFEKLMVVKRLLPGASTPELIALFLDEARLLARLNHRSIAQTYDLVEGEGGYFLAMEYIDGPSVRALIDKLSAEGQRIPPVLALEIAARVADALAYAHGALGPDGVPLEIVHRDVSPHNVLVSSAGDVKLIDFGLAKSSQQRQRTAMGMVKGKLSYLCPEQLRGERLDGRGDLFSLGIVLCEMLTGTNPFARANPSLTAIAIGTAEPRLPSSEDPALAPFDALCARLLAKLPGDRYRDGAAARDAITALESRLPRVPGGLAAMVESHFGAEFRAIAAAVSTASQPAVRAPTATAPADDVVWLDSVLVPMDPSRPDVLTPVAPVPSRLPPPVPPITRRRGGS